MEIPFGLTIPFAVVTLILFGLVLLDSQSRVLLFLLFGAAVVTTVLALGMSSPPSIESWIDNWDKEWTNTSYCMSFQYERNCCGWKDYKDRSISECPFLSISGCRRIVEAWVKPRYGQVFLTFWFIAVLNGYAVGSIFWAAYVDKVDCIWAQIEIPFASSRLYSH
jgi:hypothetical protein